MLKFQKGDLAILLPGIIQKVTNQHIIPWQYIKQTV